MGRIATTYENTIMKRPVHLDRKTFSLSMEEYMGLVNKTFMRVDIYNQDNQLKYTLTRLDVLRRATVEPRRNFSTAKPYAIYVVDYSEVKCVLLNNF